MAQNGYVIQITLQGGQTVQRQLQGLAASAQTASTKIGGLNQTLKMGGPPGSKSSSSSANPLAHLLRFSNLGMMHLGQSGFSMTSFAGLNINAFRMLGSSLTPATAAIGAFTLAVIAAAVATDKITKAALKFNENFMSILYGSGGSYGQAGALMGLGLMAGIAPGSLAGIANGFNGQLMSNPYARLAAQNAGISPNYIGGFGDINDTSRLLNFVNRVILGAPSDAQARRAAYGTSASQFLWLRQVDPSIRNQFMGEAQRMANPQTVRQAANAQALLNIGLAKFQFIMVKLGNEVMPSINRLFSYLVKHMDYLTPMLKMVVDGIAALITGLTMLTEWFVHNRWIFLLFGPAGIVPYLIFSKLAEAEKNGKSAQNSSALDQNTHAINQNTRALNNNRQTYGGGEYAQKALPGRYAAGWQNGASYQNAVQKGLIRMGIIPI